MFDRNNTSTSRHPTKQDLIEWLEEINADSTLDIAIVCEGETFHIDFCSVKNYGEGALPTPVILLERAAF